MSDRILLFCRIYGGLDPTPFSVRVNPQKTISKLRELIKEKKKNYFKDTDANCLKLRKWNQPGNIDSVKLGSINLLSPMRTISKIFPEDDSPKNECIHIIITVPEGPPRSKADLYPYGQSDRSALYLERYKSIKQKKELPPSAAAKPSEVSKTQNDDVAYIAYPRPQNRQYKLPLMLLDVVFAKFDDDCRNIEPMAEAYQWAKFLKNKMSIFHATEHDRSEQLRLVFDAIGFPLKSATVGGTKYQTDGHIQCNNRPIIILEVKNEIGTVGAEPSFGSLEYYRRFIAFNGLWTFLDELFPCFIITVTGANISLSGTVYTQRVTAEGFGAVVVDFHDTNENNYKMLARYLSALMIAYHTLNTRYSKARPPPEFTKSLSRTATETGMGPGWEHIVDAFPYPSSFVHDKSLQEQKFKYMQAFEQKPFIFQARTDHNQLVCIKFVRRYGTEVHKWCAKEGFAPELLESKVLDGGWIMIVMELLDDIWKEICEDEADTQKLRVDIESFIEKLGKEKMVHGDIQKSNIMVNDKGDFKFIDFDWAGAEGKVLYPMGINLDPVLGRPSDVRPQGEILHVHDKYMGRQIVSGF